MLGSQIIHRKRYTERSLRIVSLGIFVAWCACPGLALWAQTAQYSPAQNTLNSSFKMPAGVTVDGSGNLFVVDLGNGSGGGSAGLYEVLAAGGYTTLNSLAGGTFYAPASVALDGSGNIFVADKGDGAGAHHAGIYEVLAAGGYTTVNPLVSGTFYAPAGVTVDGSGDIFVVDYGNGSGGSHAGIYEISGATVTQLSASTGFQAPDGVAVDTNGNIFVADYGNGLGGGHAGFYEISGKTVTQLAASEGFQAPSGIAVDANDNIFVADENEATVNEVLASGSYSTVISLGNGFNAPIGVSLDWGDNVFVADSGNGRVEELELEATNLGTVEVGSNSSAPVNVTFTFSAAVTLNPASPFKVLTQGVTGLDFTATNGSTGNCSGGYGSGDSCTVSVTFTPQFAGSRYGAVVLYGSSGPIASANLYGKGIAPQLAFAPGTQSLVTSGIPSPAALTVDAGGNIFVPSNSAGTLDKITLSGGSYSAPVPIINGLASPMGVALDGSGNIFVADYSLGINEAAQSQGAYSQSQISGLNGLVGIAVDQYENLYTTDASNGSVYKETLSNGSYVQSAIGSGFINPAGIVVDMNGNVFLTEHGRGTVDELTPFNGSYMQITVDSGLADPEGIGVDASGSLYISSTNTSIIYKEVPTSNGGYARSAIFANMIPQPWWTTIDASGNLYFTANNSEASDGVYKINAIEASALSFPTPTALGLPDSTDNPQTAIVLNIGNANLTFPVPSTNNSNPSFSSGGAFSLDPSTTCPNLSSSSTQGTEAPGGSCTYAVDFTPNASSVNSGSLTLTDSDFNAGFASQNISLSGTEAAPAATPTFSPAAGKYTSIESVTIADKTAGATIYYTTNGGTPTTSSTVYAGPVTVGSNETLEAIAVASGYSQSAVGTAAYTINLPAAATPTFSPKAGTYTSIQSVTIADKTTGATIYYTTNGGTPTTSSTVYAGPVTVGSSETLKAIAVASGYSQSAVSSAAYTINLPAATTPTFSPTAGTYTSIQSVTIADKTTGATIYYTTNGGTPTTSSTVYAGPVTVGSSETLKAIAVASGYSQSAVSSAAYTINLPAATTPTFSPTAGTYTSIQSVTITDKTGGATIYYTTNGTTPTTGSTLYTSPISVSATETIKAIAVATGYSQSATASAAYTIHLTTATPTFTPAAGKYSSIQSVTIADTTTGATIYYTTNGTTPTTGSTPYTSPISVSATETIKAIALATGYSQSATASAAYTISLPAAATPTFTPAAGTYTSIQSVSIADSTTGTTIYYTTNGTTPTTGSTPYTSPISVSATETIKAIAVATGYNQSATASAAYTIHLTTTATPTFTPGAGTYASAQSVTIGDATPGAAIYYTTNGTTPTTGSTPYTAGISVSATETIKAIAVATGYSQSATASAAYTINLTTATPTFTPAAGTYTSTQSVIIGDTTAGATIYYTTNGTTPTTGSAVYSGPIAVASSETLEAIAVASGYSQSAVAAAAYTINLAAAATPTFTPGAGTYPSTQNVTITSPAALNSANAQNSLTGWDTCVLPGCDPGGTETPASTNQTVGNASPSLSGASMLTSVTANANNTNALWTFYGADCDSCTNFNVDYQVYPPTTAGLGALEYDQFQFSVSLNTEFMWGMQYCFLGSSCPGAHSSWDIWNQLSGEWVDTGITTAPILGAWNHIQVQNHRVVGDTGDCSGQPCMHYDTFILNGTLNALNLTEPASTLPGGWSSGDGFQIQMDVATVSGSTTYSEYLDQATFSETAATLYYTTNGMSPTTGSTVYNGPVTVGSSETLEAIAVASGYSQSSVGSAAYTINLAAAATPAFTPVAGTYTSAQSVIIGDTTAGATIYYTTNGTTPTTGSTVYSGPVTVGSSETLEAIAVASGYSQSATASAAYTINLPAATPTFTPVAGTYTSAQSVIIGDTTAGATIYYTTNGTTPTTGSTVYSGPVTVASNETLEAIAVASSYSQSSVGTAAYTINLAATATPTFTPVAGTYTSAQSVIIGDTTAGATIYYTTNGTTPTTGSTVYSGPVTVGSSETLEAIAVASGYSQSATASAAYTINLAAATLTLVQARNCSFSSGTTCSVTVSPALAAGNLDIFSCEEDDNALPPKPVISSVSAGGTLQCAPSATTGGIASGGNNSSGSVCYILPSSSTGGTSPITITTSLGATYGSSCYLAEYHPSANPNNVALDNDTGFQTTASTSVTNLSSTQTGTNDVCLQTYYPVNAFNAYATALTSPFNTSAFYTSSYDAAGYSVATSTGTGPTWTIASAIPFMGAACWGYNPTAFSEEAFINFEGGTNGAAPTTASMQASTKGSFQGGSWDLSHLSSITTFLSSANMPLANATGRLGDGSNWSAGVGSLGLGMTWTGTSGGNEYISYNWQAGNAVASNVSAGFWSYGDQPAAGGLNDNIDLATIHGYKDFAAINYYGNGANRYIKLETPAGGSGSTIPISASTWYWYNLTYNAGGTHSVSVYGCISGSPPTCALTLEGTLTGPSYETDYPYKIEWGQQQGSDEPDKGTHTYFDSVKISLTGALEMP